MQKYWRNRAKYTQKPRLRLGTCYFMNVSVRMRQARLQSQTTPTNLSGLKITPFVRVFNSCYMAIMISDSSVSGPRMVVQLASGPLPGTKAEEKDHMVGHGTGTYSFCPGTTPITSAYFLSPRASHVALTTSRRAWKGCPTLCTEGEPAREHGTQRGSVCSLHKETRTGNQR